MPRRVLGAIILLCTVTHVHARTQGAANAPTRPVPASVSNNQSSKSSPRDGLDPQPTEFEVLGARVRLPAGSAMRSEGVGVNALWIVSERSATPRFVLRFSRLVASEATSSPRAQVDAYVKSVSERPAPDTVFSVLDRTEFMLGDRPAASLYTSVREGTGDEEISAVQGYFIVQVAPNEFLVISSLMPADGFEAVRPLLDRCFRTVEVRGTEELAAERAGRFMRGEALIATLDEKRLRALVDPPGDGGAPPAPRWFRISRAVSDGSVQETGYMTLSAVEAEQGAANPDSAPKDWTPEEREKGLAVRVRVRTLLDERGTAVLDTDARYWMRWDRGREFWTVRSTTRSGARARTATQLGIRTPPSAGMPRPMIQVATVDLDRPATEPRKWPVPPAYVSQPEALLLTRLLPGSEASDFGFYWFDPASGRMAQRSDRVVPGSAGFTVLTRPTPEAPLLEQRCDASGRIERRSGDDGSMIEAIEPKALLDLWRRKGLPTE
jgi:hypothetical protein